jgi:glycosyltransferase involved in cell wall biosynthesis
MSKSKSILYITYDGLTDPLGQSQVMPYLIGLSEQGYHFRILSFEKKGAYLENRSIIDQLIAGKNITWHPAMYHKSPPVLSTIYDSWRMRTLASRLHRKFEFKAVWCRSYIPALAGLYLKQKFGTPFIFDMRGFWPDERVEGGSWPQSNPVFRTVYKYFKRREKRLLREADHVVVLTNKAKDILEKGQLHGNPVPKAISVVPCCVDSKLFNPDRISTQEKETARRSLDLNATEKILVYAGSLGTWYMAKEMLMHFSKLRQSDDRWKFLILTKDSSAELLHFAEALGVPLRWIIVKACTRAEMPVFLSLAHLAISFIRPVFSKQASSPTKLGEYMAMGLPVVCNRGVGDVDEIVTNARAGWLIDTDVSEFDMKSELASYQDVRSYVHLNFSLSVGLEVYEKIFAQRFI